MATTRAQILRRISGSLGPHAGNATDSRWQRIYFYLNVNRPGPRAAALEGPDSDDEAEDGGKDERKWEEQQMELAAQGKRPRLDER